ncbi:MAG: hypothetical protein M3P24_05700, partial [Gemmatimonadota bacterium]|nr:hypothetical protein [Gemmatimonadota bacterium]
MANEARVGGADQFATGVPGLDLLTKGGLLSGGLHVLLGGPGAGKSVLAHQIGAHLIRSGGRVLYLTVLVETHQMLISQARTFRFFDPGVVPGSFYYASLYPALAKGGLQGAREEISRLVAQHGPTLVILDGVHAFKASAASRLDYQRFMHEMEAQATVAGITTLLLAHPVRAIASDPTFTIADAIFELRTRQYGLRSVRLFRVEKLRGVGHVGGWHTFDITPDGLDIHPRLEARLERSARLLSDDLPAPDGAEPSPGFAIEGLDEMLGGGIPPAAATVVVGTPGSGKTLAGLAFLSAGAEAGERGLFLGFHEPPPTLVDKGEGVGLPIRRAMEDGLIHILWRAPAELNADAVAEDLLRVLEERQIRRLVIDGMEDLRHSVIPQTRELQFFVALTNLLRERGITTLILQDLPRIAGLNLDMPMAQLSAMMENALYLHYVEYGGGLRRLITILKVRAHMHDHSQREFHITGKGL